MIALLFCGHCGCQLVVTAKQLQGNPVLFRKGPGHELDLDALKVVVVVAHNDLDAVRTTHARLNLLEEGERSVFHRNTGAGHQVCVVDGLTS